MAREKMSKRERADEEARERMKKQDKAYGIRVRKEVCEMMKVHPIK